MSGTAGPALLDPGEVMAAARALVSSGGRRLLGLVGSPGAGKSTMADALVRDLGEGAVVVPMDGFHLSDAELAVLGLGDRKGAPETFDRDGYVAMLRRLRQDTSVVVRAPRFDRELESVVPDEIAVTPQVRLVVTEGNYLLHWPEVRPLLDEVWFLEVAQETSRVASLLARHQHFGRTPAAARAWVERSDEANARLVEAGRPLADRVVTPW